MLKKQKSICLLCSMGCGFFIESLYDEAVNLEYDLDDPVNGGTLCSKGNYVLELLNHPLRLTESMTDGKSISWKDSFNKISAEIKPYINKSEVGLIIGGDASTEDAAMAKLFAEQVLKRGRFAVHFATSDDIVYRALVSSGIPNPPAQPDDIGKSTCIIAVGDPFEIGPDIAGRVLKAKYAKRGNIFVSISETPNRTSRFARVHFGGSERKTLAELLRAVVDESGETGSGWKKVIKDNYPASNNSAILKLGKDFVNNPSAVLILETQDPVTAQLASLVVAAAGADKRMYCIHTYGNVGGVCDVLGESSSVAEVIDAVDRGEVKALIVLGADIVKGISRDNMKSVLEKVNYLIAGAPFENETTKLANILLPTALWLEMKGTFNGRNLIPVVEPPGGALSYGEILRRLAEEMRQTLPSVSTEQILSHKEANGELVKLLFNEIGLETIKPAFRSTTIRYADGSLTDNMSFIQLQERATW